MKIDISHLKFDERGLIPAIVQDVTTDKVLMLAYMNGQSLARTVETGYTWFWSRSRQELWNKGATSGNLQKVKSIVYDCDGDTLLVRVVQKGVACHEGNYSCFSYPLWNAGSGENLPVTYSDLPTVVDELYRKLTNEMRNRKDGSYAGYLLSPGRPDPDQTDGARDGFPPCFKEWKSRRSCLRDGRFMVSLLGTACLPWHYARPDASKDGRAGKEQTTRVIVSFGG